MRALALVSLDLFKLGKLLACDPIPDGVRPVIFLHTQVEDNRHCVCAEVARLLNEKKVAPRVILVKDDNGKNKGYSGHEAWMKYLREEFGISSDAIELVSCCEYLTTFYESEAAVRYAREQGIRYLVTVSTHVQLERAFITMVSAIKSLGYQALRVYARYGVHNWYEKAKQSPANKPKLRVKLIEGEVERISEYRRRKYESTGRLVSIAHVLSYLRRRDEV